MKCRNNQCASVQYHFIGLIISVIFGALIGLLFAFDQIAFIETALWIAFGLGVLILILLLAAVVANALNPSHALTKCLHKYMPCLITGVIGTIIFTSSALSVTLNPVLISAVILVALSAFFFSLLVITVIQFITCLV